MVLSVIAFLAAAMVLPLNPLLKLVRFVAVVAVFGFLLHGRLSDAVTAAGAALLISAGIGLRNCYLEGRQATA